MRTSPDSVNRRRQRALLGLTIVAALGIQCHQFARPAKPAAAPVNVERVYAAAVVPRLDTTDPQEESAKSDPLAFLNQCRRRYDRVVEDYSCTFTKQELIKGRMSEEQVTHVKCRQQPFSVNMTWVENAGDAEQVTYIAGRWQDDQGQDQAWCKPAGAIARLFISKILQPIHGKRSKDASRRTIDQFGFRNTLDLIILYSERAAESDELDLRYVGPGTTNGRPTLVFERRLPYTGEEQPYPDRLLVFHIDREWLLPTACFSYADDDARQLLGKYVMSEVRFNNGFDDADFGPETLGG